MKKEKLFLQFPEESKTEFYDGEVFQKIMSRVSSSKNKKLRLQQNENELKLEVIMPAIDSGSEKIFFAQKLISDFVET